MCQGHSIDFSVSRGSHGEASPVCSVALSPVALTRHPKQPRIRSSPPGFLFKVNSLTLACHLRAEPNVGQSPKCSALSPAIPRVLRQCAADCASDEDILTFQIWEGANYGDKTRSRRYFCRRVGETGDCKCLESLDVYFASLVSKYFIIKHYYIRI